MRSRPLTLSRVLVPSTCSLDDDVAQSFTRLRHEPLECRRIVDSITHRVFPHWPLSVWRDRRQHVSHLAPFSFFWPHVLWRVQLNNVLISNEKLAFAWYGNEVTMQCTSKQFSQLARA